MKMDYVEEFCLLDNNLNNSLTRMDELFGDTGKKIGSFLKGINPTISVSNKKNASQKQYGTDINSLTQRIQDLKDKHEKEQKDDMWKYEYFAIIKGNKNGPFDAKELMNLMAKGEINKNTLIWTKGMKQWSKAGRVRVLQNAFKKLPPQSPEPQAGEYQYIPDRPQAFDFPQQLQQPPGERGHHFEEGLKIVKKMVADSIKRQIQA